MTAIYLVVEEFASGNKRVCDKWQDRPNVFYSKQDAVWAMEANVRYYAERKYYIKEVEL